MYDMKSIFFFFVFFAYSSYFVLAQNGVHLRLINAQIEVLHTPVFLEIGGTPSPNTNATSPGVSPENAVNYPADTTSYSAVYSNGDDYEYLTTLTKVDLYSGLYSYVVYDGGNWPTLPAGCCGVKAFILGDSPEHPISPGNFSLRLINLWRSTDPANSLITFAVDLVDFQQFVPFGNYSKDIFIPWGEAGSYSYGSGSGSGYYASMIVSIQVYNSESRLLYSAMFEVQESGYDLLVVPGNGGGNGNTNLNQEKRIINPLPLIDVLLVPRWGVDIYQDK